MGGFKCGVLVIILSAQLVLGLLEPDDTCIKCLCHARTGCYYLTNCASYSISESYWEIAGSPKISGSTLTGGGAYRQCIKNNDCIRETIRGYMRAAINQDCNNDQIIDCKDFASIHYHGSQNCNTKSFNEVYLHRLDTCLETTMGDNAPHKGWEIVEIPAE